MVGVYGEQAGQKWTTRPGKRFLKQLLSGIEYWLQVAMRIWKAKMRKTMELPILAFILVAFIITCLMEPASQGLQIVAHGAELLDFHKVHQAPDGNFIVDDNGVVINTKTGLEWYEGPDRDTTWDEAKSWVESLSVDGGGWRMPTRDELKSLYIKRAETNNMIPLFKTSGGFVWSGETVNSSYAWGFCFEIGKEYWPLCTFSDTARGFAVRSK